MPQMVRDILQVRKLKTFCIHLPANECKEFFTLVRGFDDVNRRSLRRQSLIHAEEIPKVRQD